MNLINICQNHLTLLSLDHPVICFNIKKEYPLLFFSQFMSRIAKDDASIISLDLTGESALIQSQLETSFLGMTKRYWLGSIDALSKTAMKEWQRYLETYQGPNSLLYASANIDQKKIKQTNVIELPDEVNKWEFRELFIFFVREPNAMDQQRIDQLYIKTDTIGLDAACLLLHYMQVLGSQAQTFFDSWLDQIVIPKQSLFVLSQHFFSKKATLFLHYWHEIKDQYPEQFWISFWSDQLYRAAFYCKYMQESKLNEAKSVGYRLPFSFLQKDYRNHTFHELYHAHQSLYDLDYDLKHGATALGLDLFLYNFFAGIYKTKNI